jgi:phage terminase large subunit-like protein
VLIVVQVYQSGLLAGIGLDPARVGVVKKALEDAGIPEELLSGISQGWRLMGAILVAERMLAAGKLWHSGSRLMNYCVGNAKVEKSKNSFLVTKAASGTAKIDPLMAGFCAIELMATNPQAARPELIIV